MDESTQHFKVVVANKSEYAALMRATSNALNISD